MRFTTNYMDEAIFDLPKVIENASKDLADVDFDTLVGTGFSGGLVIPSLALALGKKFVLIRKDTDDSHHGSGRLIGELGERWVFVDDFVASGKTRRRVLDKVGAAIAANRIKTQVVGQYLYCDRLGESASGFTAFTDWETSIHDEQRLRQEEDERNAALLDAALDEVADNLNKRVIARGDNVYYAPGMPPLKLDWSGLGS